MRKFLIVVVLSVMGFSVLAQDSLTAQNSFKPVAGEKVLTLGVINNAAFWATKHYKENQVARRFGINGGYGFSPSSTTDNSFTNSVDTMSVLSTSTSSSRTFSIGIFAGVQKGFGSLERVEPYVGWDIGLNYSNTYSESEFSSESTKPSYPSSQLTKSYTKSTSKSPLNLGLAFMPVVGVNYYIAPRLAIGAEYRLTIFSVNYSNFSKTESSTESSTVSGAIPTYTTNSVTEQKTGNFTFNGQFSGQAFVTVTLLLNNCEGGWCHKKK